MANYRMPSTGRRRAPTNQHRFALGVAVSVAVVAAILTPALAGQSSSATNGSDLPAKAVAGFDAIFDGPHIGARAVHAKGLLVEGTFQPTTEAAALTKAAQFVAPSTPVVVRFSNFSGSPGAADNDPLASPRGIAIKFNLPDGGDTDIVAHSYNGFPSATPAEFIDFLTALGSKDATRLPSYLAGHPAARTFVDAPKPPPTSYATETFFGVNAFRFTNASGTVRFGRYTIVPLAGSSHLSADAAARAPANYLSQDLTARLAAGPVRFRIDVQVATTQDQTVDGSIPWPADRTVVPMGTVTLVQLVPDGNALQRTILFTPLNLVDGISPSDDPMLPVRSRSYRLSHLRRSEQSADIGVAPMPAVTP